MAEIWAPETMVSKRDRFPGVDTACGRHSSGGGATGTSAKGFQGGSSGKPSQDRNREFR